MGTTGRLGGIARHDRPRGPMELTETAKVTVREGIAGDYRGAMKPDGPRKRQVSLIEADSCAAAMADLGLEPGAIPWQERRANLLVEGLSLPRIEGARIRIGNDVVIEVVQECDPCSRMEEIHVGLKGALAPDWRGGVLGRVLAEGTISNGDEIRIEE
ncbi:MOSC domain-containing protein [Croceicoccus naphthovorans]|uniref:Molybdenum cofactor biosysynthesis protein n=1 Tax=Croceicoccus naphthovorans TaxID=1348774 RepID=A0A0G3XH19_9SPHN|nr:MOSC domain-containing protein [Croceicoccus naphthovorans]AKM09914.1 molybdenum cofactor biosysynthesis protein [Croceicoccus naphthovorans]MBB3990943.1 MOSC domain-containing protein YiiM [Croceicoccus naphthovorans]